IFRDTLAALGAAPEGAWMVGDNFEADIRPAQGLGLRTCWLAPPQRAAPVGCAPSARIGRLPELERLLGSSMHGLILAGGEGARLAAGGIVVPKPLVEVAGKPQR